MQLWVLNLDRDLEGFFIETSLVKGLGVVDLIVVLLGVEDGQLLVAVGSVHEVLRAKICFNFHLIKKKTKRLHLLSCQDSYFAWLNEVK